MRNSGATAGQIQNSAENASFLLAGAGLADFSSLDQGCCNFARAAEEARQGEKYTLFKRGYLHKVILV